MTIRGLSRRGQSISKEEKAMSRFMERLTGVLVVILIVAVSLSATAAIRIGLLIPLNGPAAEFGASARDGAELAITEWKERGGVLGHMIEVIKEDTSCDPQIASTAVGKLIDYGANFIIGGLCPIPSVAASEVANSSGALMISLDCSLPAVTVASDGINKPYVFRIGFRDDYQARAVAEFAIKEVGARKAAVLYSENATGLATSFKEAFLELGGEVPIWANYPLDTCDFTAWLVTVADADVDVIFCTYPPSQANRIGAQAKGMGITVPIVGVSSWQTGGLDHEALHGSYFSAQYSACDLRRPMVAAFLVAFRSEYQYEADVWAVLAYDAVNALLWAIEKAETDDPEVVKDILAELEFEGVSGFTKFDEHGNPVKEVPIHRVDKDDGFVLALPLSSLIPESIDAEGWDMVFEVSLRDCEELKEIDIPSVEEAYLRAWQSGDGLIWAAVYQFANSGDAYQVYDSAVGELRDDTRRVVTEDIENEFEVVTSESPLKLVVYLVRRGPSILITGSAITDPDVNPPDPYLVRKLAETSNSLMECYGHNVSSSNLTVSQRMEVLVDHSFDVVFSQLDEQQQAKQQRATQEKVLIPVEVNLYQDSNTPNGKIRFRIEIGPPTRVQGQGNENKRQYQIWVYIEKLENVQDDEDDVFRGAGDVIIGADFYLTFKGPTGSLGECNFGFRTKEIGKVDSSNSGSVTWRDSSGYAMGPYFYVLDRAGATKVRHKVEVEVADNDSSDALDMFSTSTMIASSVLALAGREKAAQNIKELGNAVERVSQKTGPPEVKTAGKSVDAPKTCVSKTKDLKNVDQIGGGIFSSDRDVVLLPDSSLGDNFEPDDAMDQAGEIRTDGTPQVHNLHSLGDHDYVSFQAQAGTSYAVETFDLGSAIDTLMYLHDRQGAFLALDEDSGEGTRASRILWTASYSGPAYVMIRDRADTAAGPNAKYSIRVRTVVITGDRYEPDDTIRQATEIGTDGAHQTHTFHTSTDADYVSFTAQQEVSYRIETGGLQGGCNTEMYLYNENGEKLLHTYSGAIDWTAPSSSTYYVRVGEMACRAGPEVSYEIWVSDR
jgi:branched-chain amino acid transport system substrate-binding protein